MGANFLKALETKINKIDLDFFTSNSLSKLKEYYALFRNISETFAIDESQFAQIFGSNKQQLFQLLDTDKNLLIDGLELFAGLALLSHTIQFQEKVKFLFSLFDFNGMLSLSRTDLEFLFFSSCSAIIKIYNLRCTPQDNSIEQFIREEFPLEQRLNISQMLKWAHASPVIAQFFKGLLRQPPQPSQRLLNSKIYIQLPRPALNIEAKTKLDILQEQYLQNCQKLLEEQKENSQGAIKDLSPIVSWVYGIRYRDVKQFLQYVIYDSQQLLLYFIGKIVIVKNLLSLKQSHYTGHRQPIISLTTRDQIAATGEYDHEPEIRLWHIKSLETIQVIRGSHVQGVHLLKFMGNFLIACGCQQESSIVIFQALSGRQVFSTYCESPAVEISVLHNYTSHAYQQFIVASLYEVIHIWKLQQGFKFSRLHGDALALGRPRITTCCFIASNQNLRYLSEYDQNIEKLILTGQEDGAVYVWDLQKGEKGFLLTQQKNEIVRLIPTTTAIIVASHSSCLTFWDINVHQREKKAAFDITQVQLALRNYDLVQCVCRAKSKDLLLMTKQAQIFFLEEGGTKGRLVQRVISVEQNISSHKLVKRDRQSFLFIAGETLIRGIDLNYHRYVRQWNIGQQIVAFDATYTRNQGLFIIAATASHKLYTYSNLSQNSHKLQLESLATAVLAQTEQNSNNIYVIVACENRTIIKYSYSKGILNILNTAKINKQQPVSLTPFIGKVISVISQDNSEEGNRNKLSLLNLKDMHYRDAFSLDKKFAVSLFYTSFGYQGKKLVQLPIIAGTNAKVLIAARRSGRIDCWNNLHDLTHRNLLSLHAHVTPCSGLSITQDQRLLFSSGSHDGMIVEWRLRSWKERESAFSPYKLQNEPINSQLDELFLRKIGFCTFRNDILSSLYDQHLRLAGVRDQNLRRMFRTNMNEWQSQNHHRQSGYQPGVSLKLDHVFGIETWHRNNTVFVVNETRRFVSFISKLVVLYDPAHNVQQFYRGHKHKVTCIVLLSDKASIASGQAAYRPYIHIWSITSLETLRIIQTVHRWGITDIVTAGSVILSCGLRQDHQQNSQHQTPLFSLQLTQWTSGHLIAQRQESQIVYAIVLHPQGRQIVSCSEGAVTFWQVKTGNLLRKSVCSLGKDTATCCIYYQGKSDADLLVGTRSGAIGIISYGVHYTILRKGEGTGQVNCLLPLKRDQQELFAVSWENNSIRILNTKFQQVFGEDIRRIEVSQEGGRRVSESKGMEKAQRNCSIQSISSSGNQKYIRLLIATRNGEILEMTENKEYANRFAGSGTLTFKAILFYRCNLSQSNAEGKRRVLVAHHPRYEVIVTVGEDQNLFFWDTQRRRLFHPGYLGQQKEKGVPTALKFSHNGDCLMVGYSDGLLVFLDSKISKATQGKGQEKYVAPSLTVLKPDKQKQGHAVLNIQLSETGQHLAVSYHKFSAGSSHSFIQILVSKSRQKSRHPTKFGNDRTFEHFSMVPCPHTQNVQEMQLRGKCGFAAYSMSFLENEGKQYLLIHYQLVDQHQNRVRLRSTGEKQRYYKVWDVSSSTVIANSSLIEALKWKKFYLHNALHADYRTWPRSLALPKPPEALEQPNNNNLLLPQLTNMAIIDPYLLLGSANGDLHISRLSALEATASSFVATTIPAHSCPVNQLELNHQKNILYSTGQSDECIIKWIIQISQNPQAHDNFDGDESDIFGEVPNSQYLISRQRLYENKFQLGKLTLKDDTFVQKVRVIDVLGRKIQNCRNNLKYDGRGRLIYCSGHAVIAADPIQKNKQLLYLREDQHNIFQELAGIQVSRNLNFLYSLHNGSQAGVLIWEISSKSLLKRIAVSPLSTLLYGVVNDPSTRILLYGLDRQLDAHLLLIDLQSGDLLGAVSYSHKEAWQVRALSFLPGSHSKFVTCGIQPTKIWQLMGNQLVYKNGWTVQNFPRINTCLAFLQDRLITGTDRGELVIWNSTPSVSQAHQNMVQNLTVSEKSSRNPSHLLISGGSGRSNQVVIWTLQGANLIPIRKITLSSMLFPPNISTNKQAPQIVQGQIQVQSLFASTDSVLIGSGRGQIYQFMLQLDKEKIQINQILRVAEGDKIRALFFGLMQEELFELGESGRLSVWSIQTGQLSWSHNFGEDAIGMVFSDRHEIVFFAFKSQLRVFKYSRSSLSQLKAQLNELVEHKKPFSYITQLTLSPNQKVLALAIEKNSDKSNLIQIYEVTPQLKFTARIKLDSAILAMDFSRFGGKDFNFMMIKTQNKLEYLDMSKGQAVASDKADGADWQGQGLLYTPKTQQIRDQFNQDYGSKEIRQLIQLQKGHFLLVDQLGGIFFYSPQGLEGQCRLNLSSADCLCVSPSRRLVGVGSRVDRNVVVLEVSLCLGPR